MKKIGMEEREELVDENTSLFDKSEVNRVEHEEYLAKPRSYQYRALIRKTFKLQMRQRATLSCQLLFPLAIILFMGLMQIRFNTIIRDAFVGDLKPQPPPEDFYYFSNCGRNNSNYWHAAIPPELASSVGTLLSNGSSSALLSNIPQTLCTPYDYPDPFSIPYVKTLNSREDLIQDLLDENDKFLASLLSGIRAKAVHYPQSSISFNNVSLPNNLSAPGSPLTFEAEIFTLREGDFPYSNIYSSSPEQIWSGAVQILTNAVISLLNHKTFTLSVNYARIQGFPFTPVVPGIDLGSWLASLLYPLIMSWLLPVYMYNILIEKETRLFDMMKMMGLKAYHYWIVNYIYFFILYLVIMIIVFALSYIFSFGIFVNGLILANIITFVL
eukprot:TRINITY_DN2078_c0_g2_i1.p1 TRINITY_DN2078_c0_g2~~TRINITY_DN2078_c0_g2_i1.p1  ORF type:complete len:384 (-),score=70.62 TRINITY_DN2078_c0_g2_i1:5-1156(-)